MLSASDKAFLKAIGVSADDIAPASKAIGGYHAVYETCPACGRMRHRFLDNGMIFCLSCTARKRRDQVQEEQLRRVNELLGQSIAAAQEMARLYPASIRTTYRGFQIARLEGQGWMYRGPEFPYRQWRQAASRLDAELQIDRLQAAPDPPSFLETEPLHTCRECGEPCGPLRWCGPCGKAKFL